MIDMGKLRDDLALDEGLRLFPYQDTEGKWTVGYGHNLDDRGISKQIADSLLDEDIGVAVSDLIRNAPFWRRMPEPAMRALANMSFCMGWPRLSTFKKMFAALKAGEYEEAARQCLDSKWAREDVSPLRSGRIAALYRRAADDNFAGEGK